MSWTSYAIAIVFGLGVGIAYGLANVRSPAPPVIALLGLLGMLIGETLVSSLRGHTRFLSHCLHEKTFAARLPTASDMPTTAVPSKNTPV